MKYCSKIVLSLLAAALPASSLGLSRPAQARTLGASAGKAYYAAQASCFSSATGTHSMIKNTCADKRTYVLPLTVDNAGSKTVRVWAVADSPAQEVRCRAIGNMEHGGGYYGGGWETTPPVPFGGDLSMTTTVPWQGYLNVLCEIKQGGRISRAYYNE